MDGSDMSFCIRYVLNRMDYDYSDFSMKIFDSIIESAEPKEV